ncbi:hypothetical protein AYI70_g5014 [Smittium culicis]|uniref:Uncharacterized protein n=1 Tax=Smittium culicis TaxID=133412 RepID=A0A1R1XWL2_9FUNG|nr:hypothetical protein AYI70_g5014 [Smittium culicis]
MLLILPPFHEDRTSLLISIASILVGCSSSCTSFQNSLGIESIPGDFLLGVLLSAAVITSHVAIRRYSQYLEVVRPNVKLLFIQGFCAIIITNLSDMAVEAGKFYRSLRRVEIIHIIIYAYGIVQKSLEFCSPHSDQLSSFFTMSDIEVRIFFCGGIKFIG